MSNKKFQLIRIGLLTLALGSVVLTNNMLPKTAFAVGELTVDWGVPSGNPIFVIDNMAPGDPCETRTVNVLNSSAVVREVGVRGEKTSETAELGSVLEIEIEKVGTGNIYGPVTLDQFFTDSAGANALSLSNHTSGQDFDYTFTVCFPESAGNEFQNASVVFDLFVGIVIPTPEDCDDIDFSGSPIFGTAGNDTINGTSGNDLIFALEGNDRIDGKGGNDCIVAGEGNDKVRESSGQDVVFGNEGNDELDGGSGQDIVVGGDGNDKVEGGSDDDLVFGGLGEDKVYGGQGADEMYGGDNNDLMEGGSGQDSIYGEEGNDNLKGGSDNDFLNGGPGANVLNGDSGSADHCINGPTIIKCEIL